MGNRTARRALSILIVLAAAGCKKTLDANKFEGTVKQQLEAAGLANAKVDCPDGVEPKQGGSFVCHVEVGGKTYDWTVHMGEVKGDTVQLSIGGVFPRQKLVELLSAEVKKQIPNATIDCGTEPVLVAKENKIYCNVAADGKTGRLRVETEGILIQRWEIEDTAGGGAGSAAPSPPPPAAGSGSGG